MLRLEQMMRDVCEDQFVDQDKVLRAQRTMVDGWSATRLAELLSIGGVDDFGPDEQTRAVLARGGE